ncbi:monofunctional biosynthetic peptidoglycan transglycosylase [Atopomonas sediminilitoris]|uniref:monofunctional biosynthetic peptidoglycan transglycosylase n=1 Tax=Atopomonas sediminilitoris TaxID=2919919 RepID=UPI001F4D8C32|nr:monofunctional biosynthetic peptidoglycan transglycosylase [Atopomonas sediminilitoris]MCJ8170566.1 monofunctional biosynthetic peptidoglycan transglycosylase [Atopomonas sediminilitoris]
MFRRLLRLLSKTVLLLMLASAALVLSLRWIDPPGSLLMVERSLEAQQAGQSLHLQRQWRDADELPDSLKIAVIAGEDQRFKQHWGFDLDAIAAAVQHNAQGGSVRGASTLSQQLAKNLFLWSGRSWPRKALEAWFTVLLETLLPKPRILELYLNTVEWGNGVFGAEAAARAHFGIGAPYLSAPQSNLLAAILPNPRERSAARPSAPTARRALWIHQQSRQLGGRHYLDQLERPRFNWQPYLPHWAPDWLKD